jgi:O-antigen/teichoic acid export membrane protein
VIATLALVPPFGIVGAAAASALGFVFLMISHLLASQRVWRMRLEARRLALLAVLLAAVAVVTTRSVRDPLGLRLLVPIAFGVLFVALGGVHQYEREAVASLWRRMRRS